MKFRPLLSNYVFPKLLFALLFSQFAFAQTGFQQEQFLAFNDSYSSETADPFSTSEHLVLKIDLPPEPGHLKVISASFPEQYPNMDSTILISITVKNTGGEPTGFEKIDISQVIKCSTFAHPLYRTHTFGQISVPSLNPDETTTLTQPITLSNVRKPGLYAGSNSGELCGINADFTEIEDVIRIGHLSPDHTNEPIYGGYKLAYYSKKYSTDLALEVNNLSYNETTATSNYQVKISNNGTEDAHNFWVQLAPIPNHDGNLDPDAWVHVSTLLAGNNLSWSSEYQDPSGLPSSFILTIDAGHNIDTNTDNDEVIVQPSNNPCNNIAGFTKLGHHNNHGYYLSTDNNFWAQAKTLTENAGGYLASINDQAENDFLQTKLGNNMVYIGYNDAQTEDSGQWANGNPINLDLSYENSDVNDYAVMNFWAGTWEMTNGLSWRKYVMEKSCSQEEVADIITTISCPTSYPGQGDYTMNVTLENTTNSPSIVDTLYFVREVQTNYDSIKYLQQFLIVPSIPAGQTLEISKTFNTIANVLPGQYESYYPPSQHFMGYGLSEVRHNGKAIATVPFYCKKHDAELSVQLNVSDPTYEDTPLFAGNFQLSITNSGPDTAYNVALKLSGDFTPGTGGIGFSINNLYPAPGKSGRPSNFRIKKILPGETLTFQPNFQMGSPSYPSWTAPDQVKITASVSSGHNTDPTPAIASTNFYLEGSLSNCADIDGYTKLGDFNNHGYYLSNTNKSWTLAKTFSENADGYLVTINNEAENNFLKSKLGNNMVFIGYNDIQTEGTGQWANGEPITLDLSYDNSDNNDYAVMNFWAGTWQLEQAGPWRKYIMEMACGSVGTNLPDLTVSNITNLPNSGAASTQVNFNFDLNNTGNATASGSYAVGMYLSTDANFSSNDIWVGLVPIGNTPTGTISAVPAAILIPENTPNGNYFLILIADDGNVISESNENNNIISVPFIIGSGGGDGGCATSIVGYTKLGEYSGHGYYLSANNKPWTQAKTLSENAGGYLVTMNDQAENDFVQSKLGNNMVFIGYNDVATEGTGEWANGEPVTLDLSYGNTSTHDYAVLNFWAGTWQLEQAGPWRKYIMEMNCGSEQPAQINTMSSSTNFQSLYPNPANDIISLRINTEIETESIFNIYDGRGQLLLSENRFLPQGLLELKFDISGLSKGVYFIKEAGSINYNSFIILR